MTEFEPDRRKVLMASGTALTVALAGCLGDDDDDDDDDGIDLDDPEGAVDAHLDGNDANGYDGTIEDLTGQDEVTIEYGTNAPDYATEPVAARISTGTTVTWEFVSDGHNIEIEESDIDFDEVTDNENEGFEHEYTFDEAGTLLYFCRPHRAAGHYGALIVE